MIDWNRITELRQEIGQEDFDDIVEIFLDEVDQSVQCLRDGVAAADLEGVMHFLKGSALNLGFEEFAKLCQAGEYHAAGRTAEPVDIGQVIACYEMSKQDLLSGLSSRYAA